MAAEWIGLVGAATSRHLVPANDCNVTVIIEDTSLLPGYGDKQVSLPTEEMTKKKTAEQDVEYQKSICKVNILYRRRIPLSFRRLSLANMSNTWGR